MVFLSKFFPLLVYPLGLACLLLLGAIILGRKKHLRTIFILTALVILMVGGNRWVAYSIVRFLENQYRPSQEIPKVDVIVVLGGATEPAQAPRQDVEINGAGDRILYAARLYQQGKAPYILVSGGNIAWLDSGPTSPASDMAEILTRLNVPRGAIWLQPDSQNTNEDAIFTNRFLAGKNIDRILLVTSAMHMPRAVALFKREGFNVIPAPTDFIVTDQNWRNTFQPDWQVFLINLIPSTGNLSLTTNALKEILGMTAYKLAGRV